jgi:hypothetical protein
MQETRVFNYHTKEIYNGNGGKIHVFSNLILSSRRVYESSSSW